MTHKMWGTANSMQGKGHKNELGTMNGKQMLPVTMGQMGGAWPTKEQHIVRGWNVEGTNHRTGILWEGGK